MAPYMRISIIIRFVRIVKGNCKNEACVDRSAKGPFQGSRRACRAAEGFFRPLPASHDSDHDGGKGRFAYPYQDVAQAQAR